MGRHPRLPPDQRDDEARKSRAGAEIDPMSMGCAELRDLRAIKDMAGPELPSVEAATRLIGPLPFEDKLGIDVELRQCFT